MLLGIGFLFGSSFLGIALLSRLYELPAAIHWCFGAIMGLLFSTWAVFLFGLGFSFLGVDHPVELGCIASLWLLGACSLWVYLFQIRKGKVRFVLPQGRELLYLILSIGFAATLMFKTFRYNHEQHAFLIDGLISSDFASHLPMIRSFSLGENIPPHAPLFGGERMRYHFLFYFAVGVLERLGLPIDWAMNILSTLGFAALLLAIAYFVKTLFMDRPPKGVIALSLFLFLTSGSYALFTGFNPSWSWGIHDWIHATVLRNAFLSGGPYYNWDSTVTGLLWTLTIFTNQRHFAFGIAVGLTVLTLLIRELKEKQAIFLGVLLGLLPFFHGLSFTSFLLMSFFLFPFLKTKRGALLFYAVALLVAMPQLYFLSPKSAEASPALSFGYGLYNRVTLKAFIVYWNKNIGIKFLLLPLVLAIIPGMARWAIGASMGLFALANMVRFGPDIWTNHKFLNIWLIFVNIGIAYLIVRLYKVRWEGKVMAVVLLLASSMTGIIDLFPIYNDRPLMVHDWQHSDVSRFIKERTEPNEIFATSYGTYHPVNLTGRATLCGWPYFSWGAGYDVYRRMVEVRSIFETKDQGLRCRLLRELHTRYIVSGKLEAYSEPYHPDVEYLRKTFDTVSEDSLYFVIDTQRVCGNELGR